MQFDPQITSTEKKTGDESDKKDNDEEMLKFILNSKQDNIKNPPIEIFLEDPRSQLKSELEPEIEKS